MTDLRDYWTPERRHNDPWGYRADLLFGALPLLGLLGLLGCAVAFGAAIWRAAA